MDIKLGITIDNDITIYKNDYVKIVTKYKKVMKKEIYGTIIGLRVDNLSIQDNEGYYISVKYYNILSIEHCKKKE